MNAPNCAAADLHALVVGGHIQGECTGTLTCREGVRLAYSFAHVLSAAGHGTFAIARDARPSSPPLAEAVSLGLHAAGQDVVHLGLSTVPRLAWHIRQGRLSGGVMIGGGAAPANWNALRLFGPGAQPVPATQVLHAVREVDLNRIITSTGAGISQHDSLRDYAAYLHARLALHLPLRLCLDAGNGQAAPELDALLAYASGLRTWRIAFETDALSPLHGPDPFAPTALEDLSGCIRQNRCDLGAAIGTDGDTLAVLDERGRVLAPDTLAALVATALARRLPGLRVSHTPDCRSPLRGALPHLAISAQIGEPVLGQAPLARDVDFHFDGAGHYLFKELPGTPSALLALIELLNELSRSDVALSQRAAELDAQPAATSVA